MATDDTRNDDESEELDDLWRGEQTQDETEDQTVDQTRDRVLDQDRGPTGNQGIDPTRFRAKDEADTIIDPMEEAKTDEPAEHPRFKLGDESADEQDEDGDAEDDDE